MESPAGITVIGPVRSHDWTLHRPSPFVPRSVNAAEGRLRPANPHWLREVRRSMASCSFTVWAAAVAQSSSWSARRLTRACALTRTGGAYDGDSATRLGQAARATCGRSGCSVGVKSPRYALGRRRFERLRCGMLGKSLDRGCRLTRVRSWRRRVAAVRAACEHRGA